MAKTTKSFYILVADDNGQGILEKAQGLYYTPTTGEVTDVQLYSLGGTTIEDDVDMQLEFTLLHAVEGPVNALKITLPEQL